MVVTIVTEERGPGLTRAAGVLARAAIGLFVVALRFSGRPAAIERTTGRVTLR